MTDTSPTISPADERLAQAVSAAVAELPGIVAVSLGGSAAAGLADERSDLDLHVYWREPLADLTKRADRLARIADAGSVAVKILTWGREDHLRVQGRLVELVYVPLDDLLGEAERAYGEGIGDEGFATARLYYVANGRLLHDPSGALGQLRARLASYPEATRHRLLASHPALLQTYLRQLRLAQSRGDLLFVQHRRYTVQMVFFNALFALNRRYHPGEKRLLAHAAHCALQPASCSARWEQAARLAADDPALAEVLGGLVSDLCKLIEESQ